MKAHDSASTAGLSVTQGDAAYVAKVLRKTEHLPLDKICAQIRQENYRDWAKWERRLDFRDTMAGRYGLTCPDQESFSFAPDGAADAAGAPVASYWRLRLAQEIAPERVPGSPVDDLPLFTAMDERRALAQDCAQDLRQELLNILERCALPGITSQSLERSYESLMHEMTEAEAWLGFALGLEPLQLEVECAVMALG